MYIQFQGRDLQIQKHLIYARNIYTHNEKADKSELSYKIKMLKKNKYRKGYLTVHCLLTSIIICIILLGVNKMMRHNIDMVEKYENMYRHDYESELIFVDLRLNLYYSLEEKLPKLKDKKNILSTYMIVQNPIMNKVKDRSYKKLWNDWMHVGYQGSTDNVRFQKYEDEFVLMKFYLECEKKGEDEGVIYKRNMKKDIVVYNPLKLKNIDLKEGKSLSPNDVKKIIKIPSKEDYSKIYNIRKIN